MPMPIGNFRNTSDERTRADAVVTDLSDAGSYNFPFYGCLDDEAELQLARTPISDKITGVKKNVHRVSVVYGRDGRRTQRLRTRSRTDRQTDGQTNVHERYTREEYNVQTSLCIACMQAQAACRPFGNAGTVKTSRS
jgi:hypothetical protein